MIKNDEYKVIPTLGNVFVHTRKKHVDGDILHDFAETVRVIANLGKENGLYKLRVEKIKIVK